MAAAAAQHEARGTARVSVGVSVQSKGVDEATAAAGGRRPRPQRGGGLECDAETAYGPCAAAP